MTLRIKLENSDCRPGTFLDLTVLWEFESAPSKISLELGWQTSGKGTEDSETVHEESWSPDSSSGEKTFRIQLPRGPISVRGSFVSIDWLITCRSERPAATCLRPLVLSHMDGPVLLTSPKS